MNIVLELSQPKTLFQAVTQKYIQKNLVVKNLRNKSINLLMNILFNTYLEMESQCIEQNSSLGSNAAIDNSQQNRKKIVRVNPGYDKPQNTFFLLLLSTTSVPFLFPFCYFTEKLHWPFVVSARPGTLSSLCTNSCGWEKINHMQIEIMSNTYYQGSC